MYKPIACSILCACAMAVLSACVQAPGHTQPTPPVQASATLPATAQEDIHATYKQWLLNESGLDATIFTGQGTASRLQNIQFVKQLEGALPQSPQTKFLLFDVQAAASFPVLLLDTGTTLDCICFGEGAALYDFSLGDIDGDGFDEILLSYIFNGAWTTMQYQLYRYNTSFVKLLENEDIDTGFQITYQDGWAYQVENAHTGYQTTVAAPHNAAAFTRQGRVAANAKPAPGPRFLTLLLQDVDQDGISEILAGEPHIEHTTQAESTAVGNMQTVLKYNAQLNKAMVVKAEYIVH